MDDLVAFLDELEGYVAGGLDCKETLGVGGQAHEGQEVGFAAADGTGQQFVALNGLRIDQASFGTVHIVLNLLYQWS